MSIWAVTNLPSKTNPTLNSRRVWNTKLTFVIVSARCMHPFHNESGFDEIRPWKSTLLKDKQKKAWLVFGRNACLQAAMLVKGCTSDTWNQIKAFLFLFPSGKTYQLCILRGKIKLCKSDYKSTLWFFFFYLFFSLSSRSGTKSTRCSHYFSHASLCRCVLNPFSLWFLCQPWLVFWVNSQGFCLV